MTDQLAEAPSSAPSDVLTFDRDVAIPMSDGVSLAADVFRPADGQPQPVILTMGPYGKDIHFADFYPAVYRTIDEQGRYMNWETVNPDWWVPRGYCVVRVDQRGTGASAGRLALQAPQEYDDYAEVIEWAADQPWCDGRVALMGVSYYAMNQWHVAAKRPRGLAAIVPWIGDLDLYRDWAYHGGILSNAFTDFWWSHFVTTNQHDLGDHDPARVKPGNADLPAELRAHPLLDDFYAQRRADLSRIAVPVLAAANLGSYALHLRGTLEGWRGAGTDRKWLTFVSGNDYADFYTDEGRDLQKRFLDHVVKGVDNGWADEPRVRLLVRTTTGGTVRHEQEWPLARTAWTRLHLDAAAAAVGPDEPDRAGETTFDGLSGGVVFESEPMTEAVEITGPSVLHLWLSSTATDADVFVTLDDVLPDGTVATFDDASGNPGPITKGWLRASHRAVDEDASTAYQPVHTHVRPEPLTPGVPVELAVEVIATSIVFEPGHRIRLTVRSCDDGEPGLFKHNDPTDRDPARLSGTTTLHTGPDHPSFWLAPVIPARDPGPAA